MPGKIKELKASQKHAAFVLLSQHLDDSNDTGIKRGMITSVAKKFDVDRSTICRLWRESKSLMVSQNLSVDDLITNKENFTTKTKKRGRKSKYSRVHLRKEVRKLPFKQRRNFKALSSATGVPKTTLHRMTKKEKAFRMHSSALKPKLTDENKISRVMYAIEEIHPVEKQNGNYDFKKMYDRVDIDEKWFHLIHDQEKYIVCDSDYSDSETETETETDDVPTRRVRHKGYTGKVQFLCAQARPRWDPHRNAFWDGKLGIWPIGRFQPARRSTRNRPAGTMEWEDTTVTRDVYRELLLDKVIPSIVEKWPRGEFNNPRVIIRIQQDGARAHILPEDERFNKKLEDMQLLNKLILYTQPPNSPDVNINDLGFFRALSAHYKKYSPKNPSEIIEYVRKAHEEYPREMIGRMYLTLMTCLNEIIENHGDNNYKIPHIGKARLQRLGQLPSTLEATVLANEYLQCG